MTRHPWSAWGLICIAKWLENTGNRGSDPGKILKGDSMVVNTVLGAVPAGQLGITLMHEHTATGPIGWEKKQDVKEVAATVIVAVREAQKFGVKTIVNAGPEALGRNVELDKIVSGETGVNIISSTGMYMNPADLPGPEKDTIERLAERFIQEITTGIGKSGVRAGAIKVATSYQAIYPYEEAILKAAARASRETGVPIITHTHDGTMGPQQAEMLTGAGADPRKVVIGHMCGNANLAYQVMTLEKEVSVSFDRWGLNVIYPDVLRLGTLIGLLGIGLGDRIVLSHDHIPAWLQPWGVIPDEDKPLMVEWSYTHIFRNIIPKLKAAGVKDTQINAMLVDNPRRIFE